MHLVSREGMEENGRPEFVHLVNILHLICGGEAGQRTNAEKASAQDYALGRYFAVAFSFDPHNSNL